MEETRKIPEKTIERLSIYRRLLIDLKLKGLDHLYSHQLSELANNTPAQVRRDLMIIGYSGKPRKGYNIEELIDRINSILHYSLEQKIALIGIGNLGRAILSYFSHQHPSLSIVAAFDTDETKINRVISGCQCYHMKEFEKKVEDEKIQLAIITVPAPKAQIVADKICTTSIKGILNFAPVPLKLPEHIFADRIDITTALEKIVYFISKR